MDHDIPPMEPGWAVNYPSGWVHKVKPTYFPDSSHLESPLQHHSQVMTQLMSEHLHRREISIHSHKDSIFHLHNSVGKPFLRTLLREHRDRTPVPAVCCFPNFY